MFFYSTPVNDLIFLYHLICLNCSSIFLSILLNFRNTLLFVEIVSVLYWLSKSFSHFELYENVVSFHISLLLWQDPDMHLTYNLKNVELFGLLERLIILSSTSIRFCFWLDCMMHKNIQYSKNLFFFRYLQLIICIYNFCRMINVKSLAQFFVPSLWCVVLFMTWTSFLK